MTGKMSIVVLLCCVFVIVLSFALVSHLVLAPEATTGIPLPITCVDKGLQTDPNDTTKCLSTTATSSQRGTTTLPDPPPAPEANIAQFNNPVTVTTQHPVTFTDGLKLTLNTINDSRCKPDVQCIWAGELAPEFSATGGALGKAVFMLNLGTVRSSTTTQGPYTFTLIGATEKTMIITVIKKSVAVAIGTVKGHVTIGPICPVERIDSPCSIPAEVYTSRNVIVYGPTEDTEISQTKLQSDGTFTLQLTPGTYWLQIEPAGIGPGEKKKVIVLAGKSTTVDFDIDTGIR